MPADEPFDFAAFVGSTGWKFASSMPTIPHEYTLRGKRTNGVKPPPVELHDTAIEHIHRNGYPAQFYGRTYVYLEHEGWKFWVVDDVINRERLPEEAA